MCLPAVALITSSTDSPVSFDTDGTTFVIDKVHKMLNVVAMRCTNRVHVCCSNLAMDDPKEWFTRELLWMAFTTT